MSLVDHWQTTIYLDTIDPPSDTASSLHYRLYQKASLTTPDKLSQIAYNHSLLYVEPGGELHIHNCHAISQSIPDPYLILDDSLKLTDVYVSPEKPELDLRVFVDKIPKPSAGSAALFANEDDRTFYDHFLRIDFTLVGEFYSFLDIDCLITLKKPTVLRQYQRSEFPDLNLQHFYAINANFAEEEPFLILARNRPRAYENARVSFYQNDVKKMATPHRGFTIDITKLHDPEAKFLIARFEGSMLSFPPIINNFYKEVDSKVMCKRSISSGGTIPKVDVVTTRLIGTVHRGMELRIPLSSAVSVDVSIECPDLITYQIYPSSRLIWIQTQNTDIMAEIVRIDLNGAGNAQIMIASIIIISAILSYLF